MYEEPIMGILSSEEVLSFNNEMLELLTKISTGIIIENINMFIKYNIDSSNETARLAAIRLSEIYASVNRISEYLASRETRDYALMLNALDYSNIAYDMEISKLEAYRDAILKILPENMITNQSYKNRRKELIDSSGIDCSKLGSWMTFTSDNFKSVTEAMLEVYQKDDNTYAMAFAFVDRVRKNKKLFVSTKAGETNNTVLTYAIKRKEILQNILECIDFVLTNRAAGVDFVTWRRC